MIIKKPEVTKDQINVIKKPSNMLKIDIGKPPKLDIIK